MNEPTISRTISTKPLPVGAFHLQCGWQPGQGESGYMPKVGSIVRLRHRPLEVGTVIALDAKVGALGSAWVAPGADGGNEAARHGLAVLDLWTGCPDPRCPNPSTGYACAVYHCTEEATAATHARGSTFPAVAVAPIREGEMVSVVGTRPAGMDAGTWQTMISVEHLLHTEQKSEDGGIIGTLQRLIGEARNATWQSVAIADIRSFCDRVCKAEGIGYDPSETPRMRVATTLEGLQKRIVEKQTVIDRIREAGPLAIRLHCPSCGELHIDEGEFSVKPHHTHSCQHCGETWRPAVEPTLGVEFLPGFLNAGSPRNCQRPAWRAKKMHERIVQLEAALAGAQETERQLREEIAEMGSTAHERAEKVLNVTGRMGNVLKGLLDLFATDPLKDHAGAAAPVIDQLEALVERNLLAPRADLQHALAQRERYGKLAARLTVGSPVPPFAAANSLEHFEHAVEHGDVIAKVEWTHKDTGELQKLQAAVIGGHKAVFGHAASGLSTEPSVYALLQATIDAAHRERRYRKVAEEIGSWFTSREDAHRPFQQAEALEKLETLLQQRKLMPRLARAEVLAFACAMETGLAKRQHGYWLDETPRALLKWLKREVAELERMLPKRGGFAERGAEPKLLGEAACIAALAMMIADVRGALDVRPVS